jgi:hypothetical protein
VSRRKHYQERTKRGAERAVDWLTETESGASLFGDAPSETAFRLAGGCFMLSCSLDESPRPWQRPDWMRRCEEVLREASEAREVSVTDMMNLAGTLMNNAALAIEEQGA